ncbi:MAG: VCBS repeat-containing protein, partial [Acidobacteriota bacterium]|nr:VCBS repeat-containing protein [Acidobacteriota bacterium]
MPTSVTECPSRPEAVSGVRRLLALLLLLTAAAVSVSAQSFSLPASYTLGSTTPGTGVAGDFNGDGKPDLAVNGGTSSISVMLNKGDGTFSVGGSYETDLRPTGVALGDFNKDGKPDLAVANVSGGPTSAGSVSILVGKGDGMFQSAVNFAADSPFSVVAVDLNADGNLDLVLKSSKSVTVLLGNGDATFRAGGSFAVGDNPYGIAVADFNKDGKPDVAATNYNSGVSLLMGNGDGTFQPAVTLPFSSLNMYGPLTGIAAADLNADGNQDIVALAPNASAAVVFMGKGDGSFQPAATYQLSRNVSDPWIADFNGDGKLDIAV